MARFRRCLPAVVLALGALFAACDGGGGPSTPSARPSATATADTAPTAGTPSAVLAEGRSPAPDEQEAPEAPVPGVPEGVALLALGEMNLDIGAGESYKFDPLQLARDQGLEPPACAAFLFLFGWQVREPFPPQGAAAKFRWTGTRRSRVIGEGESGEVSIGCGGIEVVNDNAEPITVQIRYGIGEIQG